MKDKKIIIKFAYDYDYELGYTLENYKVNKEDITELGDTLYITVYGKLEEE